VRELFLAARELPEAERDKFLTRACAGEGALRSEVESLLAHDGRLDLFLAEPALGRGFCIEVPPTDDASAAASPGADAGADGFADSGPDIRAGIHIDGYTIGKPLGSGGMGVVFEAEQQATGRKVALKVLRRSIATPSAIRRFRNEVRFLALLEYPGIARLYDAGIQRDPAGPGDAGGVPWFAMELVRGARRVTEHVHQLGADPRMVLRLFARICDAVEEGHRRGVVHRDLKPANVLVDGAGNPSVIDFGVARALDESDRPTETLTATGQLVGTLQYMSPEQCGGSGRVNARSDVYSLGVMLYEALSGRLPYDAGSSTILEATRIIQEIEPRRLSRLVPSLGREATVIVHAALSKDPQRRYGSAGELGADIRRALAGELIVARPPSIAYRARSFLLRHRVVCSAAIAVSVLAAALVVAIDAVRSRELEQLFGVYSDFQAVEEALERQDLLEAREIWNEIDLSGGVGQRIQCGFPYGHLSMRCSVSNVELAGHAHQVRVISCHPNEDTFVSGGGDGRVYLWTADGAGGYQRRLLTRFEIGREGTDMTVIGANFTRDGQGIVAVDTKGRARMIDIADPDRPRQAWERDFATEVGYMDFSPDGRLMVMGCGSHYAPGPQGIPIHLSSEVMLIDTETGARMGSEFVATWNLFAVDIDESNRRLIAGGADGFIYHWDIDRDGTLRNRGVLVGHSDQIMAAKLVPGSQGDLVVSASIDGTVKLWDIREAGRTRAGEGGWDVAELDTLATGDDWLTALDCDPDGRLIAAVGASGKAYIIDILDGCLKRFNSRPHRTVLRTGLSLSGRLMKFGINARSVALGQGGSKVVIGYNDGRMSVQELPTPPAVPVLSGHESVVLACDFIPNPPSTGRQDGAVPTAGDGSAETRAVTAGGDHAVRIWDLTTCDLIGAFFHEGAMVEDVYADRQGREIVTISNCQVRVNNGAGTEDNQGVLSLWDLETGTQRVLEVRLVSETAANKKSGETENEAGSEGCDEVSEFTSGGDKPGFTAMLLTPEWDLIAIGTGTGRVGIGRFDRIGGATLAELEGGHADIVRGLAVSQDRRWLATTSTDARCKVWDLASRQQILEFPCPVVRHSDPSFHPSRPILALPADTGYIRLIEIPSGRILDRRKALDCEAYTVDFSADGNLLASGHADGSVIVWDVTRPDDMVVACRLHGHTGFVCFVQWDDRSRRILSCSSGMHGEDNVARVWESDSDPGIVALRRNRLRERTATCGAVENCYERLLFPGVVEEELRAMAASGALAPDHLAAALTVAGEVDVSTWDSIAYCWKGLVRGADFPGGKPMASVNRLRIRKGGSLHWLFRAMNGMSHYRAGRPSKALEFLEQAMPDPRDDAVRLAFLAMALADAGRDEEARSVLRQLHASEGMKAAVSACDAEEIQLFEEAAVRVGLPVSQGE